MTDSGSVSFGINFEPENGIHQLLEQPIRQRFEARKYGTPFRVEFTGVTSVTSGSVVTDNGKEATATFTVEKVLFLEVTPEDFHYGADECPVDSVRDLYEIGPEKETGTRESAC